MKIELRTDNCSYENHYLIEPCADSAIKLRIEIPNLPNMQARKKVREEVSDTIQSELSKFKWLITGSVLVDFVWFLNAVERQETDKVGDLDNISKPIQDALSGPKGILIDDSQIGGLHTSWMTRNNFVSDNLLEITIKFNNDYVLTKENLMFVQYSGAMCLPLNFRIDNIKDLFVARFLIKGRLNLRRTATKINRLGSDVDRYFVCSQYDYHRTRLNEFPKSQILTMDEFNRRCSLGGLTFKKLIGLYRGMKK